MTRTSNWVQSAECRKSLSTLEKHISDFRFPRLVSGSGLGDVKVWTTCEWLVFASQLGSKLDWLPTTREKVFATETRDSVLRSLITCEWLVAVDWTSERDIVSSVKSSSSCVITDGWLSFTGRGPSVKRNSTMVSAHHSLTFDSAGVLIVSAMRHEVMRQFRVTLFSLLVARIPCLWCLSVPAVISPRCAKGSCATVCSFQSWRRYSIEIWNNSIPFIDLSKLVWSGLLSCSLVSFLIQLDVCNTRSNGRKYWRRVVRRLVRQSFHKLKPSRMNNRHACVLFRCG